MANLLSSISTIIESDRIIRDASILESYSRDLSYPLIPSKTPDLVVKIESSEEIVKLVQLANREKIPLIPRSSKFSIFGGAIPEKNGVILDLQDMNRIKVIDRKNMYVVIEPGVTFKQLQHELDKEGLRILPTIYDASNSIITNYLERYPRFSMPKFEYTDLVSTLEVILPTGETFNTGSKALPHCAPVYPYGPSLDFYRIFHGARGSFGVVASASIRVKPKPAMQKIIPFMCEKLEDFIKFIYQMEKKEIGTECLILNKIGVNLIFPEGISEFKSNWNIFVCLEGLERYPRMKIDYEEKELLKLAKEHKIQLNRETTENIKQSIGNEFNLPQSEYRRRQGLFNLPLYSTLNNITAINSKIEKIFLISEVDINLGILIIPIERGRVCYFEYIFDCTLENEKEVENFKWLFKQLGESAISSGAMIDTPFGPIKEIVYSKMRGYRDFISSIKGMLDPNNILNPGKIG